MATTAVQGRARRLRYWPSRYGDGLIARIGAQDMDAATAEVGVRPFDMTGRPMRGIVVIDSAVLNDRALDRWIGAGLPPK